MLWICKLTGSVLVMGAAFYFAVNINQAFENRNLELRKLYSILLQLKSEIQYMGNTLPESFQTLSRHAKEPFLTWFNRLTLKMEQKEETSFQEIWKEELEYLYRNSALEKEDVEPLSELSDKLGSMDVSAQLKAIDYALLHIERNRNLLEGELSQKKKVVITLSLFCGFMTLILLL